MRRSPIVLALSLIACAGVHQAAPTAASTARPAQARAPEATQPPAGCVSGTATRLPVKPEECNGPGTQWSRVQLTNTGHASMGQALRDLDPAITLSSGASLPAQPGAGGGR
jgi:hypothetical protein